MSAYTEIFMHAQDVGTSLLYDNAYHRIVANRYVLKPIQRTQTY